MTKSDSETESSSGGSRIRHFHSSKDYPLWSKRVVNHRMGASLLGAIIPDADWEDDITDDKSTNTAPSETLTKLAKSYSRINRKAYTFIYARLHDDVLCELSPEVSDPAKPDARALWDELKARYGGGTMHELVSTIDVILSTRVDEGEDPREKLNDMRSAFLKLNGNSVLLDDKFFALLVLKAIPESYSATVQVLFSQPNLSSDKVISSARNYWDLKTKTKDDDSSVALTARKNFNNSTNRNYNQSNFNNPPRAYQCIHHPGANSHNTVDCRKAKHIAQVVPVTRDPQTRQPPISQPPVM